MVLQLLTSAGGEGKCIKIWESEGNGRVFALVPLHCPPGPALRLFRATAYFSFLPLSLRFLPFCITSHMTRIKAGILL